MLTVRAHSECGRGAHVAIHHVMDLNKTNRTRPPAVSLLKNTALCCASNVYVTMFWAYYICTGLSKRKLLLQPHGCQSCPLKASNSNERRFGIWYRPCHDHCHPDRILIRRLMMFGNCEINSALSSLSPSSYFHQTIQPPPPQFHDIPRPRNEPPTHSPCRWLRFRGWFQQYFQYWRRGQWYPWQCTSLSASDSTMHSAQPPPKICHLIHDSSQVCYKKPPYSKGGKQYPTCGLACAAKVSNVSMCCVSLMIFVDSYHVATDTYVTSD